MTPVFVSLVRYADLPSTLDPGASWGDLRFLVPELGDAIHGQELYDLPTLDRLTNAHSGSHNWGRSTMPLTLGSVHGYLKREVSTYRKNRLAAYVLAGRYTTKCVQEFVVLRWLRAHRVNCPRPLALWTRRRGSQIQAALFLEALRGYRPLTTYLEQAAIDGRLSPPWTAQLMDSLAQFAVRLHNALVHNPDLFAWHVFVRSVELPKPEDFAVIDLQRALILAWRPCCVRRARDLAALLATISDSLIDRRQRQRFLERYMELARPRDPWRPLFPRVLRRRIAHWRARSKVRRALAQQEEVLARAAIPPTGLPSNNPAAGTEVRT